MKLNGAQIVVECLKEQGVDTVFGYPGGSVIKLYDELYKQRDAINHVLTAHEQGASHAADGYARATGKVGVCIATSGPGATNLVTGIATAYMDSVPMVAITGNVPVKLLGKDSFQEVDISGITIPITKHNYIVKDVDNLASTIREAFRIAREGRPGPVLIDITKDVTLNETEFFNQPVEISEPFCHFKDKHIHKAISLIKKSKKPFIYVGGGVVAANASQELQTFVDLLDAPVGTSLMGIGAIPSSEPKLTGMIGMHGTNASNVGVNSCDLLVCIGARFSDRVVSNVESFAKHATILQIDVDPAEIDKNVVTNYSVVGDIKLVLQAINRSLDQQSHPQWVAESQERVKNYPPSRGESTKRPREILTALKELAGSDAILVTEVGQHQMWAAQLYGVDKPRHWLTSGGLGTMGYGTGAAIGAKFGCPDKRVISIAGDGCFRMNFNEIETAAKSGLDIVVILMNNQSLGMVRQWQTFFFDKRYSATELNPHIQWVKLVEALGGIGFELPLHGDPKKVLSQALAVKGKPVVVNCEIPKDDKVFPMVAPGTSIDNLIDEDA